MKSKKVENLLGVEIVQILDDKISQNVVRYRRYIQVITLGRGKNLGGHIDSKKLIRAENKNTKK